MWKFVVEIFGDGEFEEGVADCLEALHVHSVAGSPRGQRRQKKTRRDSVRPRHIPREGELGPLM